MGICMDRFLLEHNRIRARPCRTGLDALYTPYQGHMHGQDLCTIKRDVERVSAAQIRALTKGAVCGAPLIFDALCGHAAAQDPPLLLMFMLMTGLSWCVTCFRLAYTC